MVISAGTEKLKQTNRMESTNIQQIQTSQMPETALPIHGKTVAHPASDNGKFS